MLFFSIPTPTKAKSSLRLESPNRWLHVTMAAFGEAVFPLERTDVDFLQRSDPHFECLEKQTSTWVDLPAKVK